MLRAGCLLVVVGVLAFGASPAGATWSVIATDSDTGEVGVAMASCVPASALGSLDEPFLPVVIVPGRGAGVSHGFLNDDVSDRMATLIDLGRSPLEILDDLTDPDLDDQADERQHAIVVIDGSAAGFTGDNSQSVAVDIQADGVSAQGVLLSTDAVVSDALAAFNELGAAPLGDRLVAALVAGSEAGGDVRCGTQTALFAQLAIARPGDAGEQPTVLITHVVDSGSKNPVLGLAADWSGGGQRSVVAVSTSGRGGALIPVFIGVAVALTIAGVVAWRRAYRG